MASPALSAALLLVFSCVVSPSSGVTLETLADICRDAYYPTECESVLKSDPRTSSADLPQLSLISIEITKKRTDESLKVFPEFRDNVTSPDLKAGVTKCIGFFWEIESQLQEAHKLSEQRKYNETAVELNGSKMLVHKCAAAIPVNSIIVDNIIRRMTSATDASLRVNQYVDIHISGH